MANFHTRGLALTQPTRETDMNTTETKTTSRAVRRLAVIAIVGGLALSFAAAFAALRADPEVTGGGLSAWITDYIAAVSEAFANGG
jgi:hypothetical protein